MISELKNNSGFSAVELLVTLFIGAAFILTGYQLYVVVVRDGAEVRARSVAYNIAADYSKRRAANTATVCSTTVANHTENPSAYSDSNLPNLAVRTRIEAPYGCGDPINAVKVTTTVTYGQIGALEEVVNAILVVK